MIRLAFIIFIFFSQNAFAKTVITPYEIKEKISDNIEIRQYPKLLLAQIATKDEEDKNDLFQSLFKFIDGQNQQEQEIRMTAPVFQEQQQDKEYMSFAMPCKFSEDTLPKPNNQDIKIKSLENQKFIAIRFSGRSTIKNFNKYQKILEEKIAEKNIKVDLSNPIRAYYNPPWTIPFFKRNEVLFKVK